MKSATYVSNSKNVKIAGTSKVDATYASIKGSCPNSCPLKNETCYAEIGNTGIHSKRLDKGAEGKSSIQIAREEAKAIDSAYDGGNVPFGRNLRLHVSGDCPTKTGAKLINKAVGRWKDRGGGIAWSYIHAWKQVPRNKWSNVSILASVSTTKEVSAARKQGYAPAIIVDSFEDAKAFKLKGSSIKWIPCPAQTRDVPCIDCKLCFNDKRLYKDNFGIAFAAHSARKNKLKYHLKVLNEK